MSFWITCEKFGVAFDTRNPWQLAFGLAEPPLLAAAVPAVANAIVIVPRTSSFFGLFARDFASLGAVSDANVEEVYHWWGPFFPGLVLTLILIAIYFVGDGLRDAFDPATGRNRRA